MNDRKINTQSCTMCPVCGEHGDLLHTSITDRIYFIPGRWNIRECSNPKCGSLWLDPAPIEQDLPLLYKNYFTHQDTKPQPPVASRRWLDKIGETYLCKKFGYRTPQSSAKIRWLAALPKLHPMWKDILNAHVFYLPAHPGGRLLEIGCGNGNSLKFLQQIGWCVTGLDFDSEAVANAKTKGLDVHLGQLKDQRFPDATFDAIVMSHVIEHVPRPGELLRECHRVLKKNGTLVVLTPNAEGFLHKYHQDSWRGLEPPRHLQIFTPRALEKISMDSGFRQNKLLTSMNGHIYINLASMEIAKKTRHDMQRQYPLMHRIPIHVGAFFLSWWKTLFRKYAGDEIVLIAHKESHTATNHAPSHSQ